MAGDTKPGGQVLGLDLLRLAAASLVVFYHFGFWHLTAVDGTLRGLAAPAVRDAMMSASHFGWVGVEIFFLISGYVIAFSSRDASPSGFARSRLLRLFPGIWLCAPITFLLYLTVLSTPAVVLLPQLARTLLLFPLSSSIDGVYWTIGIEVSFYLLIWSLIVTGRRRWIERLPLWLGLLSLGFWVFYFVGLKMVHADAIRSLFNRAIAFRPFQLLLLQHGCFFGLGVGLRVMGDKGVTPARLGVCAGLLIACGLEIVAQNGIIERASRLTLSPIPSLIVWSVAFAAACLMIRFNDNLGASLGRRRGQVRQVGLMTYPLYLIHNPVGLSVAVLAAPALGLFGALALGVALAFVTAGVVSAYAEPALRKAMASLWPRPLSQASPALAQPDLP